MQFPKYPKIQSIYKRDKKGKFIVGEYPKPEIEYLVNNAWIWTEKIDGTNIRICWDHEAEKVIFKGRNENSNMPSGLLEYLHDTFTVDLMKSIPREPCSFMLVGEGYGAGIQKAGVHYLPDRKSFILFDVWMGGWWLMREAVEEIGLKVFIRTVPYIGKGSLFNAETFIRRSPWSWICEDDMGMEGIVCSAPVLFRNGNPAKVKLKVKDYAS